MKMTEIILTAVLCAVLTPIVAYLFCFIKCRWYLRQLRKLKISDLVAYPHYKGLRTGYLGCLEVHDQRCISDVKRLIKDIQFMTLKKKEQENNEKINRL